MKNIRDLVPDIESPELEERNPICFEKLSDVTLNYFRAESLNVQPYRSTRLSWDVGAGNSMRITLNGQTVNKIGTKVVRPTSDTPFILKAVCGNTSRLLSRIDVTVDLDKCIFDESRWFAQTIDSLMYVFGRDYPNLKFRGNRSECVQVVVTDNNIYFSLQLEYTVDNFPNPYVNISGNLGLVVVREEQENEGYKLDSFLKSLSIDSDFTFEQKLLLAIIPGSPIIAPIQIGYAKDAGRNYINQLIDRVIRHPWVSGVAPEFYELQNVRVRAGNDGLGNITRIFCPFFPMPNTGGNSPGSVEEQ